MDRQPDIWSRNDHHLDQPVSIKLERGQKGGYGWEIKIYGETVAQVIGTIEGADKQLKVLYGGSNEKQTT